MAKPVYKRVLLKISGEALAGDKHTGLDFEVIGQVCDVIKECLDMGRPGRSGGGRRQLLARCEKTAAAPWSAPGPTTWECWPR